MRSIVMQSPSAVVVNCSANISVSRSRRSVASVMPVAGRRPDPRRFLTRSGRRRPRKRSVPPANSEADEKVALAGRAVREAQKSAHRDPLRVMLRSRASLRVEKEEKRRARSMRHPPVDDDAEVASAGEPRVAKTKGRQTSPRRPPLAAVAAAGDAVAAEGLALRIRSSRHRTGMSVQPALRNSRRSRRGPPSKLIP